MKPQHSTVGCTEEAPELRDSCLVPEPSPDGSLPEHMVSERDESGSPDAKRRKSEREAQPHEVGCAGQPCASADAHAAEGASFPDVVSVPHDAAAMVESSKPPHGGSSAGCHGVASPNGRPGTSAAFPADECKEGGGQDGFPFKTECLATGVIPSPNANELLLLGGHGGMDEYTLGLPEQFASVPSGVFDEGAHFPSDTSTEEIDSDDALNEMRVLPSYQELVSFPQSSPGQLERSAEKDCDQTACLQAKNALGDSDEDPFDNYVKSCTTEIFNRSNAPSSFPFVEILSRKGKCRSWGKKKAGKLTRRTQDKINRLYFCPVRNCGKGYGTTSALHVHQARKHPEIDFSQLGESVVKTTSSAAQKLLFASNDDSTCTASSESMPTPYSTGSVCAPSSDDMFTPCYTDDTYLPNVCEQEGTVAPVGAPQGEDGMFDFVAHSTACGVDTYILSHLSEVKCAVIPLSRFAVNGSDFRIACNQSTDALLLINAGELTCSVEFECHGDVYRLVNKLKRVSKWSAKHTDDGVTFTVDYFRLPSFQKYAVIGYTGMFVPTKDVTHGVKSADMSQEYTVPPNASLVEYMTGVFERLKGTKRPSADGDKVLGERAKRGTGKRERCRRQERERTSARRKNCPDILQ